MKSKLFATQFFAESLKFSSGRTVSIHRFFDAKKKVFRKFLWICFLSWHKLSPYENFCNTKSFKLPTFSNCGRKKSVTKFWSKVWNNFHDDKNFLRGRIFSRKELNKFWDFRNFVRRQLSESIVHKIYFEILSKTLKLFQTFHSRRPKSFRRETSDNRKLFHDDKVFLSQFEKFSVDKKWIELKWNLFFIKVNWRHSRCSWSLVDRSY